MISEKKRLPSVAMEATIKDKNTKVDVEFKIIPINFFGKIISEIIDILD
jgi:hypothetical protein